MQSNDDWEMNIDVEAFHASNMIVYSVLMSPIMSHLTVFQK